MVGRARKPSSLDRIDLHVEVPALAASDLGTEGDGETTRAVDRLTLSARGFQRVLRVARAISDLEDGAVIQPSHVAEALRYRPVSDRAATT